MAEYTENYNLKKPAQEDFYNVEDFNNNADVIDKELKAVSNKANSALPATSYTATDILNKLKTVDGANSGLDADLFKGKSVIPIENGGTGENNLKGFFLIKSETPIAGKLSDITEAGIYNIWPTSNYTDMPNFLGTTPFGIMVVYTKGTQTYQWIFGSNSETFAGVAFRYISTGNNPSMTDWRTCVTDKDIAVQMQSALQSGGVSVIKSIQRGIIEINMVNSASATIKSVNTNKAVVLYTGYNLTYKRDSYEYEPYLTLTNSTTVTARRNLSGADYEYHTTIVPYQVIEFY